MKWSLSSDSRIYPLFLSESRVLQPSFTFHPSLELAPTHDRVFSARNIHLFILQVLFIHSSNRYYSSFHSSFHLTACIHHSFIFCFETCTIHSFLLQVLFIFHPFFHPFIHSLIWQPAYTIHSFIFSWNMHYSFNQSPFTPFLPYGCYSLIPYRRNHLVIHSIIQIRGIITLFNHSLQRQHK